ncbi:hypothetical protein C5E07_05405 [Pseudoclavibacter sp. RFBJ3]|uniref:hypothetical protein n=1 Tax=unclassified Pseudoclavibacter TaxID=2615177 RepID=UPI000CE85B33|nr:MULTISPECIES: hypothetical protein [unclassified Pseudoclavibacter]PPF84934.1 hypothetical protein C5C12_06110 [Pseudoclavibacter sp. RFBJ5]PPF93938.1 hypothetical protein C5E07_05405 [Pseudoclavibacter sp. RFBJ3]PPF98655.1 hypothetical protein C5C19_08390 [Pseudoclavibacter sp. RFBH5]PPG24384.1 hypothetical protein C5E13_06480 [Pseudoclavibacter sp. RFBI4]
MPTSLERPAAAPGPAASQQRLFAFDTARFIAIVGMVASHVSLIPVPGLNLLIDGPPSTLFAVLGGASAVLASRGRVSHSGRLGAATALVVRGLLLLTLGFVLQFVSGPIVVVLVPFGVTLVLLAPLLWVPTRWLLSITVGLAVAGPIANHALRSALALESVGELSFDSPWAFLHSVTFTGTYPVVTWLTYALIGVVGARAILAARAAGTSAALGRRLAVWGIGASVAATVISPLAVQLLTVPRLGELGMDALTVQLFGLSSGYGAPIGGGLEAILTAAPHSGSTGDIVRTAGLALAVVGLLVRREAMAGVSASLPARIIRAGGAAPLTLYVAHILSIGLLYAITMGAAAADSGATWLVVGLPAFALQLAILGTISFVLAASARRGPLETCLSTVSLRVASATLAVASGR